MDNIDIKDFQSRSQVVELDNILLSLSTGVGGKMTVALLKSSIIDGIEPQIKDGMWWIGDVNTQIPATGKTPILEFGSITTGAAGTSASAEFTPNGVDGNGRPRYKLDLTVPRGDKGETGSAGEKGAQGEKGDKGDKGDPGEIGRAHV